MKSSIRRQLLAMPAYMMAVMLCMQVGFAIYITKNYMNSLLQTNLSMVETLQLSVSDQILRLNQLDETISFSKAIQDYMGSDSLTVRMEAVKNLSDTMNTVKKYNPDLADLLLVDLEGNYSSIHSFVSFSTFTALSGDYAFNDPENSKRAYLFFDNGGSPCYALAAPVFSLEYGAGFRDKIGSLLFVCRLDGITQQIESLTSSQVITCYITDHEGKVIALGGQGVTPDQHRGQILQHNEKIPQIVRDIPPANWQIVCTLSPDLNFSGVRIYLIFIGINMLLFVLMMLFMGQWLNKQLSYPIQTIYDQLAYMGRTGVKSRLTVVSNNEIGAIALRINDMMDELEAMTRSIVVTQGKMYEVELLSKQAQLSALQSQINPHFLYNTLECVRGLAIMHHVDEIATIATAMSNVFRYSIKGPDLVTVRQELEILEQYLKIMNIRFMNRIRYILDIDPCVMDMMTLKMILQPVAENAIYHGLELKEGDGLLRVTARLQADKVRFSLCDDGVGMPPEQLLCLRDQLQSGDDSDSMGGLGLGNINKRIRLYMGEDCGVSIQREAGVTTVTVIINQIPNA